MADNPVPRQHQEIIEFKLIITHISPRRVSKTGELVEKKHEELIVMKALTYTADEVEADEDLPSTVLAEFTQTLAVMTEAARRRMFTFSPPPKEKKP